jgi:hypothetical protein
MINTVSNISIFYQNCTSPVKNNYFKKTNKMRLGFITHYPGVKKNGHGKMELRNLETIVNPAGSSKIIF